MYGGTYNLFAHTFPQIGIEARFAAPDDIDGMAAMIDDRTKAVYCESLGNPAGNIPAPAGSMDDSRTRRKSSDPLEEENLNRARYLAPRPLKGPFQHEHLQNMDGEVSHIGEGILRRGKDTGVALSKKPDKSGFCY